VVDLAVLLGDLNDESAELDAMVGGLSDVDFERPTPSPGWTIAHQIAHLGWTDTVATIAVTDPDGFNAVLAQAVEDPLGFVDRAAIEGLAPPPELLARWRAGRSTLADALIRMPAGTKAPWFATAMSATSMATGRLMETWAHGGDVADALGVTRQPTSRLRHIAYLGYRAMGHSFATHVRPVPEQSVRVELAAPAGTARLPEDRADPSPHATGRSETLWTFGPEQSANVVTGTALDFCLLVTQRRHRDDLALEATGPIADEWLDVAQAFAGPPGAGRAPAGVS
jgi:uncharacterized protein (TIGR03084 family)